MIFEASRVIFKDRDQTSFKIPTLNRTKNFTRAAMPASYNIDTTGHELATEYASIVEGKVILVTGVSPGGLGAHFL